MRTTGGWVGDLECVDVLERGRRQGHHPGYQLIVLVDGEPVISVAGGAARDGVPLGETTLLPWMCISKPVVVLLLLTALREARLSIDTPVARVIDEFERVDPQLSFRALATHRVSWHPRVLDVEPWGPVTSRLCTPGALLDACRPSYSLYGSWALLGTAAERLTGTPLPILARRRVFEPLGMDDCWMGMPPSVLDAYGDRIGRHHPPSNGRSSLLTSDDDLWLTECWPGFSGVGPARQLADLFHHILGGESAPGRDPRFDPDDLATMREIDGDGSASDRLFGWRRAVGLFRDGLGTIPTPSLAAFGEGGLLALALPEPRIVVVLLPNGALDPVGRHLRERRVLGAVWRDLARQGAPTPVRAA